MDWSMPKYNGSSYTSYPFQEWQVPPQPCPLQPCPVQTNVTPTCVQNTVPEPCPVRPSQPCWQPPQTQPEVPCTKPCVPVCDKYWHPNRIGFDVVKPSSTYGSVMVDLSSSKTIQYGVEDMNTSVQEVDVSPGYVTHLWVNKGSKVNGMTIFDNLGRQFCIGDVSDASLNTMVTPPTGQYFFNVIPIRLDSTMGLVDIFPTLNGASDVLYRLGMSQDHGNQAKLNGVRITVAQKADNDTCICNIQFRTDIPCSRLHDYGFL